MIYVQVVDKTTGIYQCGKIEEPVQKGFEIQNAIGHFGIKASEVEWKHSEKESFAYGEVIGTNKCLTVIIN